MMWFLHSLAREVLPGGRRHVCEDAQDTARPFWLLASPSKQMVAEHDRTTSCSTVFTLLWTTLERWPHSKRAAPGCFMHGTRPRKRERCPGWESAHGAREAASCMAQCGLRYQIRRKYTRYFSCFYAFPRKEGSACRCHTRLLNQLRTCPGPQVVRHPAA